MYVHGLFVKSLVGDEVFKKIGDPLGQPDGAGQPFSRWQGQHLLFLGRVIFEGAADVTWRVTHNAGGGPLRKTVIVPEGLGALPQQGAILGADAIEQPFAVFVGCKSTGKLVGGCVERQGERRKFGVGEGDAGLEKQGGIIAVGNQAGTGEGGGRRAQAVQVKRQTCGWGVDVLVGVEEWPEVSDSTFFRCGESLAYQRRELNTRACERGRTVPVRNEAATFKQKNARQLWTWRQHGCLRCGHFDGRLYAGAI